MTPLRREYLPYISTERLQEFFRGEPSSPHLTSGEVGDELTDRSRRASWRRDSEQVYALLAAGWTFEVPSECADPMSFYWRSPPKGKRELGRKYLSTNQAHNAMLKQAGR